MKARYTKPSAVATYVMSATQTLSLRVTRKFLFTRSSAAAPSPRRVVPLLFSPRMQPCSPDSRMSLATLFLEHRAPTERSSARTLGEP